jgi:hypothetical protein
MTGPPATPGAAPLGGLALGAHIAADPVVRYTVERAMAEVRAADKRTRQMMLVEIAARQLAIQIVEYEEAGRDEPSGPHHGPPPGMGDEGAT